MHIEFGQKIIDIIRRKKQPTKTYDYSNGNKLIYIDKRNVVTINPNFLIKGLDVNFYGNNSTLIIHSSNKFTDCVLNIGDENFVIIKEDLTDYPYKHFSIVYPMAKKKVD